MTKVLIIANQFPPMGGPGVQRTAKFVKYLRSFGYESVVLTRGESPVPLRDESMLADIPEGVSVLRTPGRDCSLWPQPFTLLGKFISRKLLVPDGDALWARFSRKIAMRTVREHNIGLIYTTSYPYSGHLLGLWLKKKIPSLGWVCDFRDEWTNNPYTLDSPHSAVRAAWEKRLERRVLAEAGACITNTPVMLRNFLQNNTDIPGLAAKFSFIPNGYDQDDFTGLAADIVPKNAACTLTYTGSLYGRRRPDAFFAALAKLHGEGLVTPGWLQVRFIGNYHRDRLLAQINTLGIAGYVSVMDYMPHADCLRMLLASDALLLIEGEGRGADAFYTGKIFEYMNAGKPVLALLPHGCAEDLVRETGIGTAVHVSDADAIARALLVMVEKWRAGNLTVNPDQAAIAKYGRRTLTGKLAEVFDRVTRPTGK